MLSLLSVDRHSPCRRALSQAERTPAWKVHLQFHKQIGVEGEVRDLVLQSPPPPPADSHPKFASGNSQGMRSATSTSIHYSQPQHHHSPPKTERKEKKHAWPSLPASYFQIPELRLLSLLSLPARLGWGPKCSPPAEPPGSPRTLEPRGRSQGPSWPAAGVPPAAPHSIFQAESPVPIGLALPRPPPHLVRSGCQLVPQPQTPDSE